MLFEKDIKEVKQVENIDEANEMIKLGWVLLETGSRVENDETMFFFLLGKTALMQLKERAQEWDQQEKEKNKNVVQFKPES
ncbi:hypothetical protein DMN77_18845 [Paenibacillus sp. 79R4]|uniref:hypothetical protein n=1 Tax=Paenibacillus sp. 79R4 TaxID=2212847 RepID=UPI0015B9763B|nr:hypothetical protein [Paenibacillus sp. 79R4]NWL89609.1 hypothetical protein [Paenibacillus sp. 79R4]